MTGATLVRSKETGEAFPPEVRVARRVAEACKKRGLVPRVAAGDVIGLAPPLIVTAAQVQKMMDILNESLAAVTVELRAEGLLN